MDALGRSATPFDRRRFLGLSLASAGAWCFGPSLRANPVLGLGREPVEGGRILVVLQLSGGNDGLNTVVPYEQPEYYRARGSLAIAAKDVHRIGSGVGLHPGLSGLAQMYGEGKLAVIQGVGYPKPNRSHFKSMDIWHSADPTGRDHRFGWLGRALDSVESDDPARGINISSSVPLALNGRDYKPVSFQNPGAYRYAGGSDVVSAFERIVKNDTEDNPVLERLRRTAAEAVQTSAEIRRKSQAYRTTVAYPRNRAAVALKTVAGLIAGGMSTSVYYTYLGGFDTHTNQARRHANLMTQLSGALVAFQKDLEKHGLADRVVVMAFSEFGRRVKANGSGGTDHGVAGPVFVLGQNVKGGVHGEHPSLVELTKGDLIHSIDFRRVYATLLDGWMGIGSQRVLHGDFEQLGLLRA